MRCFKNILTIVATYLLVLSMSMPTYVYGITTGENLAMERLKTIQEYVQVMKNEISEIKTLEDERLVDEGKRVQLELELDALIVKSGIPESGTKVTINSEGTKTVEITDSQYKEQIDEIVSDEKIEEFAEVSEKIHRVLVEGEANKQEIVDKANKDTIESILGSLDSIISDIDYTAEKQNYDINSSEEGTTLYGVKENFKHICEVYCDAKGEELLLLLNRTMELKDTLFSFAMNLVDKVVV